MSTNMTERNDLSLGDMVVCSAYIRPSGWHFEIYDQLEQSAYLIGNGQTEGKEVDGFESCEKFVTKTALFTGVFVGVTTLCTELFCEESIWALWLPVQFCQSETVRHRLLRRE